MMVADRFGLIGLGALLLTATAAFAQNTSNPTLSGNTANPVLKLFGITFVPNWLFNAWPKKLSKPGATGLTFGAPGVIGEVVTT